MSFDPPPDPPPGANVPPPDPHRSPRQRGRLTDPDEGAPRTDAPQRQERRERIIVMTFLWGCVVITAAFLLLVVL